MNLYNAEGYIDLTAYEALSRIEREERKAKKAESYRPLVYICSPYSQGCINDNIENARRYSRFAVDSHCIPITPHIYFTQFMAEIIAEMVDFENEMKQEEFKLAVMRLKATAAISKLTDDNEREVLRRWYLMQQSEEKIRNEMGYSQSMIYEFRKRGFKHLETSE